MMIFWPGIATYNPRIFSNSGLVLSWYFSLGGCSYWKRAWPGVWLVWLASRVINFVWLLRPAVIFPTCQKSCSRTGGPQRVASSPAPDNTTSVMFQYFDKRAIHCILGRRSQTPNFPRQSGHFMKRYQWNLGFVGWSNKLLKHLPKIQDPYCSELLLKTRKI